MARPSDLPFKKKHTGRVDPRESLRLGPFLTLPLARCGGPASEPPHATSLSAVEGSDASIDVWTTLQSTSRFGVERLD